MRKRHLVYRSGYLGMNPDRRYPPWVGALLAWAIVAAIVVALIRWTFDL